MWCANKAAVSGCLTAENVSLDFVHPVPACAVEVILAAPGKVPKEEKLYVQKATFGKVKTTGICCLI
jgi:hypothetical protein